MAIAMMTPEDDKHRKRDKQIKHGLTLFAVSVFGIMAVLTIWQKAYHYGHHDSTGMSKLRRKNSASLLKVSSTLSKDFSHHLHAQAEEQFQKEHLTNRRRPHANLAGSETNLRKLIKEKIPGLHQQVDPED